MREESEPPEPAEHDEPAAAEEPAESGQPAESDEPPLPLESPPDEAEAGWRATLRRHRRAILAVVATAAVAFLVITWLTWPDVAALREENPDSTAFIDGYLEQTGRSSVAWNWVPASRISPHLKEAVVVAEDMEFFSHAGFSTYEIKQAIEEAVEEGEAPRGASTITQQLAKNLWLNPSRSLTRKAREVILTKQLEWSLSKNRILELYLNVVEFGPGIYGAEAAARHYFGKPAADLTQREAAMLAASLPRPKQWHPGVESQYYARRVNDLVARMREVTYLDRRFGIEAMPEPAPVPMEVTAPATITAPVTGAPAEATPAEVQ